MDLAKVTTIAPAQARHGLRARGRARRPRHRPRRATRAFLHSTAPPPAQRARGRADAGRCLRAAARRTSGPAPSPSVRSQPGDRRAPRQPLASQAAADWSSARRGVSFATSRGRRLARARSAGATATARVPERSSWRSPSRSRGSVQSRLPARLAHGAIARRARPRRLDSGDCSDELRAGDELTAARVMLPRGHDPRSPGLGPLLARAPEEGDGSRIYRTARLSFTAATRS